MTDILLLGFIFLAAGVVAVPLASKLGLGSVLGYLIAGILIGPMLNFLSVDVIAIQHFAELGVVMMLFLVGLELEPKLLWEMKNRLIGLGGGQILGTVGLIMVAGLFFGLAWQVALSVGLVLALSSTAIVLQTLDEKGLMKSDGGQASFSVLLFQDIAVIPMLALLPLLAVAEVSGVTAGDHEVGYSLVAGLNAWQTALVSLAAIAVVILSGSYLTRPIFRFIAAAKLRELFTATALMMIVGIALLMTLVGLSPALGTFLAGVILANSEYRHELESDIEPFKGLLLGLFFMTVGAGINLALMFEDFFPILGLTLGLIVLKASVLLVLGHFFKLPWSNRWLFALGLAQAGEFGFVLLALTVTSGIIPEFLADRLLLVVALSMLITPALFIFYDRVIAPYFDKTEQREADAITETNQIIIAGKGRVGGIIDRMLVGMQYSTTVIDYSSKQLEMLRAFGSSAYFGDATRPDLLESAGIAEAKVLVVAIDDKEQITKLVKYAVQNYPDLHVIARAVDRDHVYDLWFVGCRDIIRETYDSSLRMGRSALEALGLSKDTANALTDLYRQLDQKAMIAVAEVYEVDIPSHENERYLEKLRTLSDDLAPELRKKVELIMKDEKRG